MIRDLVLRGGVSRCRAVLLGNRGTRPVGTGPERRHGHRRPAYGLRARVHIHHHHLLVLPAARLHTHLSPARDTRRPIRLAGRARPHVYSVGVRHNGHGRVSRPGRPTTVGG